MTIVTIATLGKGLMVRGLIAFWKRRDPPIIPVREFSPNPTDNLQIAMNLVMPLADPSPVGRAQLIQKLAGAVPEVVAGLNNTAVVHFARFTIVDGNLCMFSMYDGDFSNYIRDFIYNIGEAFDALLAFVKDPPLLPVEEFPDAFIEWVRRHDSLQLPERITDLSDDVLKLPRRLTLILDDHPNTQLFTYRAYAGHSVAQIRNALDIGW
jgi:hypothetical protein